MACVTVLVGQCGTQLGGSFLHQVSNDAQCSGDQSFQEEVSERFFRPPCGRNEENTGSNGCCSRYSREKGPSVMMGADEEHYFPLARCVMVDMEPKAIENLVTRTNGGGSDKTKFRLAATQCVTRDEGSANNWAFGYYHQGASRYDVIVDNLRRESEMHGTVQTFHVVHSIAGGTGSGVGCLISEAIRDSFPHTLLLHSIVWPFSAGEVTTQWYNTVLAMSCLRDEADAICALYNDDISNAIASRYRHDGLLLHPSDVSYPQINAQMARTLSNLHLPSFTGGACAMSTGEVHAERGKVASQPRSSDLPAHMDRQSLRRCTTADIVEALALNPARKIFTGTEVPSVGVSSTEKDGGRKVDSSLSLAWSQSVRAAVRSTETQFMQDFPCLWSLRGRNAQTSGMDALLALTKTHNRTTRSVSFFASSAPHVEGRVDEDSHARECASGGERLRDGDADCSKKTIHESISTTVFGSTQLIGSRLTMALTRAEEMLQMRAFLHHYERYGVERSDFNDAIVRLWDTASYYSEQT